MKQVCGEGNEIAIQVTVSALTDATGNRELEWRRRAPSSWDWMIRPLSFLWQSATDCRPCLGKRLTLVEPAPEQDVVPSRDCKLWVICPLHSQRLGQQALKEGRPGVAHNDNPLGKAFMKRKKNCKPCQKLCLICATFQSLHDFIQLSIQMWSLQNFLIISGMDFFYVLHCSPVFITTWYLNIYIYLFVLLGVICKLPLNLNLQEGVTLSCLPRILSV